MASAKGTAAEEERLLDKRDLVIGLQVERPKEIPGPGMAPAAAPKEASLARVVPRWWAISKLWFVGEERWKARGYALATVVLTLCTTGLLLKISYVQNSFQSALSEKNKEEFSAAIRDFVLVIAVAAPLFALNEYVDARIMVEWRAWLAGRLLAAYFGEGAYYRLTLEPQRGIDNPDQRICDDVRSYAASSVMLAVGIFRKVFYVCAFGGLLFSIAPRMVGYLVAYAVLGTLCTTAGFGRRLMRLTFAVLQREADLRFALVRVRENAEAVAFYRGEGREAAGAAARLRAAVAATYQKVAWESGLALWTNAYSYATILVPAMLMAPKYFAGEVRFGTISQVSYAFNRIEAALSYIINNLVELSGLAAQTERLDALMAALAGPAAAGEGAAGGVMRVDLPAGSPGGLSIEGLTLQTPGGGQTLCQGLDLAVGGGGAVASVLIVGPSGCGKSSLMRAAAGLWGRGSGMVRAPPPGNAFFLSQKAYMPLGSLRQQLTFPDTHSVHASDADLEELLELVCLPGLLQRVGGLDATCDWASVLSLGEQQRVAFLRLLLHRPSLAFLDESTSALDEATEAALYAALRERCPAYLSIGHRMQLVQYHSHVLEYQGDARWALCTAEEFSRQRAKR